MKKGADSSLPPSLMVLGVPAGRYRIGKVRRRNVSSLLIAARSVTTRYMTISPAAIGFRDAMPRPTPMIDEPTYSGCATYLYGPDEVTSRALFRWPAAHTRTPSPGLADARAVLAIVEEVYRQSA